MSELPPGKLVAAPTPAVGEWLRVERARLGADVQVGQLWQVSQVWPNGHLSVRRQAKTLADRALPTYSNGWVYKGISPESWVTAYTMGWLRPEATLQ